MKKIKDFFGVSVAWGFGGSEDYILSCVEVPRIIFPNNYWGQKNHSDFLRKTSQFLMEKNGNGSDYKSCWFGFRGRLE